MPGIEALLKHRFSTHPRHYGERVVENRENFGLTQTLTFPYKDFRVHIASQLDPNTNIMTPRITVHNKAQEVIETILARGRMNFVPVFEFFPAGRDKIVNQELVYKNIIGVGRGHRVDLAIARALVPDAYSMMNPQDTAGIWIDQRMINHFAYL